MKHLNIALFTALINWEPVNTQGIPSMEHVETRLVPRELESLAWNTFELVGPKGIGTLPGTSPHGSEPAGLSTEQHSETISCDSEINIY